MIDMNILRKQMEERVDLYAEISELRSQIDSKEKEVKRLKEVAEIEQADVEALSGGGIKNALLGFIGRKDAMLEKEQREARDARLAAVTAEFEFDSMKRRIDNIEQELIASKAVEKAYLTEVKNRLDADTIERIQRKLVAVQQLPIVCEQIGHKNPVIKRMTEDELSIYTFGDVKLQQAGFNRNVTSQSLWKISKEMEKELEELLVLLKEYNLYVPEEYRVELQEEWMITPQYLYKPEEVTHNHDGFVKIEKWHYSFRWNWKKLKNAHREIVVNLCEELKSLM